MIARLLSAAFVILVAAPSSLHPQDTAPLGKGSLAIKGGYVVFDEGVVEDDGIYLGLEGYARVAANLYVGGEVSGASSVSLFSDEMSLIPIEVNAKYAGAVGSNVVLAGGIGLSYSYAEFQEDVFLGPDVDETAWLFGGQLFGDLMIIVSRFALGIGAKYQLVQDFEEVAADFSNIRVGVLLGIVF